MKRPALLLPVLFSMACDAKEEPMHDTSCQGDFQVFEPGMRITTAEGGYEIELLTADPSPPDEGSNRWTVALHPLATGSEDASVMLTPWMPAHGHGISPPDYQARAEGTALAVPEFDLIMPGVWEFQLLVTDDTGSENATVSFCIEG